MQQGQQQQQLLQQQSDGCTFVNVNIPYYVETLEQVRRNMDLNEIKDQLNGDGDMKLNIHKEEHRLSRTKSIQKVYAMKTLRNKKDPSKIIYKLTKIGETSQKLDFNSYKDIIFQQPISNKALIESFKEEVVESPDPKLIPSNPRRYLQIKKNHVKTGDSTKTEGKKDGQMEIEDKIEIFQEEDDDYDEEVVEEEQVLQQQQQQQQQELAQNVVIPTENVQDQQQQQQQISTKSAFLLDELNPRLYYYCIQPQQFMKNYKLNKLELFRENDRTSVKSSANRTKNAFQSIQISYDSKQPIPNGTSSSVAQLAGQESFMNEQLFVAMKHLFDSRPIWIRNSLIVHLNALPLKYTLFNFRKALAMLSYNFKDGPWKHAYVRFGYDPRVEKEAVAYQVIDIVVLDREEYESAKEYNPLQNTYDPRYIEKPQHYRHMYTLCEIEDEHVKKFFQKSLLKKDFKQKLVPCKKSGWLQPIDVKRIQKFMKDKFKFN